MVESCSVYISDALKLRPVFHVSWPPREYLFLSLELAGLLRQPQLARVSRMSSSLSSLVSQTGQPIYHGFKQTEC